MPKQEDKVIQERLLNVHTVLNRISHFSNVTNLFTFRITAESHEFYGIIIFNLIVHFICHLHCRTLNKIPLGHEINRKPFHAWQQSKMQYLDWITCSTNADLKITAKIFHLWIQLQELRLATLYPQNIEYFSLSYSLKRKVAKAAFKDCLNGDFVFLNLLNPYCSLRAYNWFRI